MATDPTRSQPQLLLVEDNDADVVLTEEALREGTIAVSLHRVADGVEALAFLRRERQYAHAPRPDLILLDLNMPRMDGRELLRHVKNDAQLHTIPVVVLTTSLAERDIVDSYELRANCYIKKPAEFEEYAQILGRLTAFWFGAVRLPPRQ